MHFFKPKQLIPCLLISTIFFVFLFFTSCTDAKNEAPVQVAVFQAEKGVGPSSEDLIVALGAAEDMKLSVTRITSDEIRAGKLVDVGPAPGGRMDPPQLCLRGKFLAH